VKNQSRKIREFLVSAAFASALLATSGRARALDKQASAHGGRVGGQDQGMALSGSLLVGVAAYNPTYAARPDNTGHALLRVAPHLDLDLIGRKLSLPLDLNLFTDRDRSGVKKLLPTELDVISGVTSTWPLGAATALELGLRGERDLPVDRAGTSQSYADARTRLLYDLAPALDGLSSALAGGDLTGSLTLGWFAYNPSYAARPDNTGRALFRYGGSTGLDFLQRRLSVGVDLVSFTDRQRSALRPSELDFTPSLGYRSPVGQFQLAYERDMPLDRGQLVQQFMLISWSESFDVWARAPSEAKPGD
jgi:hypothetical protein